MSFDPSSIRGPAVAGALLALVAAVLFGISTPLVQRFGVGVGAFTTAALLYAGAAIAGAIFSKPPTAEARIRRREIPRLFAMASRGAVIGPVALAWGLQRTSGSSASLMLTLEALFTAVLAWRFFRETMDRRVGSALLLLLAGGFFWSSTSGAPVKPGLWDSSQWSWLPPHGGSTTRCRVRSRSGIRARLCS